MKNLVLLALGWAFAISQLFAQKQLPPSAATHLTFLTDLQKKLVKAAGFDPQTFTTKQGLDVRATELQLDSTLSFYDYGLNGNDSLPLYKSRFSYPNEDVQVEVQAQHENGGWLFQTRTTSVFDEQERLVDMFAQVYDPTVPTWVSDSRMEIFPHGNSPDLLDSVLISAWDVELHDWVRLMTIENFFDAQDRIYESHSLIAFFGTPQLFTDIYTYDSNGDNTLIESYYVEPGLELLTNVFEMKYQNHLLISKVEIVFDGVDFIPQTRETTEYNSQGLPSIIENYEWAVSDSNWVNVQSTLLEYDDQDRLSAKETANHYEGVEDERHRFEYRYIEGELLLQETSYFFGLQENMFLVDGKKYYFYNGEVSGAPGRPREIAALNLYPNPTNGLARIALEGKVAVQVFDARGQVVVSQAEQSGLLKIDLTALPAGIYTVQAYSADKHYIGRLVKQ